MLEYEWGNAPPLMLAQDPDTEAQDQDLSRQSFFDHYSTQTQPFTDNLLPQPPSNATFSHHHHHNHHQFSHNPPNFTSLYDPRAYGGASLPPPPPSMLTLDPGYLMVPKSEEICRPVDFTAARIGLNLGGRTYFSSDDDFVNRLYRRPRPGEPGSVNSPRCQAEGCNADLSHAKHYHRRHKVCEFHSKASTVIAAGLTQRFCQQCSRFHLLSEFDNGKRSCRRRLADHNRRRRKSSLNPNQENLKARIENSGNPSSENNTARSPPSDSGAQSSSSVTVAISPPRMSLDSFRQRPFQAAMASSSSFFFSSA